MIDQLNIWRAEDIIKLLIMLLSPTSRYFFPLRPKYLLRHPTLEHRQQKCDRPMTTPTGSKQKLQRKGDNKSRKASESEKKTYSLSNFQARRQATVGSLRKELAVQELTNTNTCQFSKTYTRIRNVFTYTSLSLSAEQRNQYVPLPNLHR